MKNITRKLIPFVYNKIITDTLFYSSSRYIVYQRESRIEYNICRNYLMSDSIDFEAKCIISQEERDKRYEQGVYEEILTETEMIEEIRQKRISEKGECLAFPFGMDNYYYENTDSLEDIAYFMTYLEGFRFEEEYERSKFGKR